MSKHRNQCMRQERPTTRQSCSESSSKAQEKRRRSRKRHFGPEGTWFPLFAAKVRQRQILPLKDLNFRDIPNHLLFKWICSVSWEGSLIEIGARWQFWFWFWWLQGSALKGRGRGRGRPAKGKVGRPPGSRGLKRPAAVTCPWSWSVSEVWWKNRTRISRIWKIFRWKVKQDENRCKFNWKQQVGGCETTRLWEQKPEVVAEGPAAPAVSAVVPAVAVAEEPRVRLRLRQFRGQETLLGAASGAKHVDAETSWTVGDSFPLVQADDTVAWLSSTFAARRGEKHW